LSQVTIHFKISTIKIYKTLCNNRPIMKGKNSLLSVCHLFLLYQLSISSSIADSDNSKTIEQDSSTTKTSKSINFRTDEQYKSKLLKAYNVNGKDDKKIISSILGTNNMYGIDESFCIHDDGTFLAGVGKNGYADNNIGIGDYGTPTNENKRRWQQRYKYFFTGCKKYSFDIEQSDTDSRKCVDNEIKRVDFNLYQPATMKNFTEIGFQKLTIPKRLHEDVNEFNLLQPPTMNYYEKWPIGNTHVNHWSSPTYMVQIPQDLKDSIIDAVTPLVQQFLGIKEEVMVTSMYGIRMYSNGAIISPHVDVLPFVATAVLNVAQKATNDNEDDDDWPIELYAHDGNAYNVTLNPGDMLLYEGHSIIHGRPFPFQGEYYSNIYIHFEPIGYSIKHKQKQQLLKKKKENKTPKEIYQSMLMHRQSPKYKKLTEFISAPIIPEYIQKDTSEEKRWLQTFPDKPLYDDSNTMIDDEKDIHELLYPEQSSRLTAHHAAKMDDVETLKKYSGPELRKSDHNGWQPIHEAARAGNVKVVEYLIEEGGADVNMRTNFGRGGSPLYWARTSLDEDHEVIPKLQSYGAKYLEPTL